MDPVYTLVFEDDEISIDLEMFLIANDLPPPVEASIRELPPQGRYLGGGGAAPEWEVRRRA